MNIESRLRKLEVSRQNTNDDCLILIRRKAQADGTAAPSVGFILPNGQQVHKLPDETEEELQTRAICTARKQPIKNAVMVLQALKTLVVLPDNGRSQNTAELKVN